MKINEILRWSSFCNVSKYTTLLLLKCSFVVQIVIQEELVLNAFLIQYKQDDLSWWIILQRNM